MRAMRLSVAIGALLALALTGMLPAGAGNGTPNPNWFNDPTEGPSPNNSHFVGNSNEEGRCGQVVQPASLGGIVLGGVGEQFIPGVVAVQLRDPDTDTILRNEEYDADPDGDWGASSDEAGETGLFPIPADLAPDEYPLTAQCFRGEVNGIVESQGLVVLGGEEAPLFTYEERSYTVLLETPPRDPEDVEPTFTG